MPATLVAHTIKSFGTNGTSSAIDTTGSTLLVFNVGSNNTTFTISDSQGGSSNSYTQIGSTLTSGGITSKIFYCLNPTHVGSNHTFSVSGGSFASLSISAWSGIIALDQHNGATYLNASSTIRPGSITPTYTNELVVTTMIMDGGGATAVTISGGYSISDQVGAGANGGQAMGYIIQSSVVATNPTWSTTSSTCSGGCQIASFRADNSVLPTSGSGMLIFC